MKNSKRFWLVAVVASSLSFVLIILSVLLSDYISDVLPWFDLKSKLYGELPAWFMSLYSCLKTVIMDFTTFSLTSKFEGLAFKYVPIIVALLLLGIDIGAKDESSISFLKIGKLYKSLKDFGHPTRNLSILFWSVRLFYWCSIIIFSISWFNMDYPVIILIFLSGIIIYMCGMIYNALYEKWIGKNHKK